MLAHLKIDWMLSVLGHSQPFVKNRSYVIGDGQVYSGLQQLGRNKKIIKLRLIFQFSKSYINNDK